MAQKSACEEFEKKLNTYLGVIINQFLLQKVQKKRNERSYDILKVYSM